LCAAAQQKLFVKQFATPCGRETAPRRPVLGGVEKRRGSCIRCGTFRVVSLSADTLQPPRLATASPRATQSTLVAVPASIRGDALIKCLAGIIKQMDRVPPTFLG